MWKNITKYGCLYFKVHLYFTCLHKASLVDSLFCLEDSLSTQYSFVEKESTISSLVSVLWTWSCHMHLFTALKYLNCTDFGFCLVTLLHFQIAMPVQLLFCRVSAECFSNISLVSFIQYYRFFERWQFIVDISDIVD